MVLIQYTIHTLSLSLSSSFRHFNFSSSARSDPPSSSHLLSLYKSSIPHPRVAICQHFSIANISAFICEISYFFSSTIPPAEQQILIVIIIIIINGDAPVRPSVRHHQAIWLDSSRSTSSVSSPLGIPNEEHSSEGTCFVTPTQFPALPAI